MFHSSMLLKTSRNLRFLKFLVVREKNIDLKRDIHRIAEKLFQAGQKSKKKWYKIFLLKHILRLKISLKKTEQERPRITEFFGVLRGW